MKKANWITIPEKTIHTPVSDVKGHEKSAKKSGASLVQNKLFWGIGFVILIVATFAVLAPQQFSTLLRGSLFDTSGVPEGEIAPPLSPLSLVPSADEGEGETMEEPAVEPAEGAAEDEPLEILLVEPEGEAVTISIEPLGPVDCGSDADCFYAKFEDCTLAKYKGNAEDLIEFEIEITGSEGENCLVYYLNTENIDPNFVGTEMECEILKDTYDEQTFLDYMGENQTDICSGSFIDMMLELQEEAESMVTDGQSKTIEDLTKELEALKSQKDLQDQAMQDLAELVQEDLKAAAPPSVTTTTTLGQPPAVQPGFRVNTHVVSVTPEQMLSQNLAQGVQAPTQIPQAVYQPAPQPVPTDKTPETGPEVWVIALIAALLGLAGYKVSRVFV